MVDIHCATAEARRGKKKVEEERNHRAKIFHRAAIRKNIEETTGQEYNVRICYAGRP